MSTTNPAFDAKALRDLGWTVDITDGVIGITTPMGRTSQFRTDEFGWATLQGIRLGAFAQHMSWQAEAAAAEYVDDL